METTSVTLFISLSLVVFGISYYYFTTRHKERMAIIEKGLSPHIFKGLTNLLPFIMTSGIVSIGVAVGIAFGAVISSILKFEKFISITVSVFLFLGLALILSYFLLKRMQKKE